MNPHDPNHPMSSRQAWRETTCALRSAVQMPVGAREGKRPGVALLIVLVTTAVMGALSTEFAYNTRTNIWMAGNVTADTQAYYHARSAAEIAHLAVNAKRNFPQMKAALSLMGKGAATKLEIWRQACEFVNIFATGKASFFGMDILDMSQEEAIGVKKGSLTCRVTAEDSRTNLNAASTDPPQPQQVASGPSAKNSKKTTSASPLIAGRKLETARRNMGLKLYGLFRPFMESGQFDSEDEMLEVILNIMDWTDGDDTKTDVGPDGNFVESGGAEGADYGQYGYEVKNARMDTVGEVQLVEGLPSEVFCRIRDKLTVFSTGKLNVNDADLATLKGVLCQALPDDGLKLQLCWNFLPGQIPAMDEALLVMETCRELKKAAYSTPFTSMSQFVQFFQRYPSLMGSNVTLPVNARTVQEHLGVTTTMVRVEAEGVYRGTKRKITTVVDLASGATTYNHIE